MTQLDCNHDCQKCPAWTLGGRTNCILINEIMKKLVYETDIAHMNQKGTYKEMNKQ